MVLGGFPGVFCGSLLFMVVLSCFLVFLGGSCGFWWFFVNLCGYCWFLVVLGVLVVLGGSWCYFLWFLVLRICSCGFMVVLGFTKNHQGPLITIKNHQETP